MWSKRRIDQIAAFLRTAGRFGATGVTASVVHVGVAAAAISFGVQVLVANSIAFLVALAVSLIGHHFFSFQSRAPFWRGVRRFAPAAFVGFFANNFALGLLVALTGDTHAWIKVALAILVIPPATFSYAYFFAYRS